MRRKFHIGDLVQTEDLRRGYVIEVQMLKERLCNMREIEAQEFLRLARLSWGPDYATEWLMVKVNVGGKSDWYESRRLTLVDGGTHG